MDAIVLAAVLVVAPSIIALLALRYGADSRPSQRSSEHALAIGGMRWDHQPPRALATGEEPRVRLISLDEPGTYPTLAMVDRMRAPQAAPFATDPHADRLEPRARQLVDEYWSDACWLTGLVPAAAFRSVCQALEREQLVAGLSESVPVDASVASSIV